MRVVGGAAPNTAGTRFLLAVAQAWHVQAEAVHGQMSAVATGLPMALLQKQMDMEVGRVAPDLANVPAAHNQLMQQPPPPPTASWRRR